MGSDWMTEVGGSQWPLLLGLGLWGLRGKGADGWIGSQRFQGIE